jgi:hypothetical protein
VATSDRLLCMRGSHRRVKSHLTYGREPGVPDCHQHRSGAPVPQGGPSKPLSGCGFRHWTWHDVPAKARAKFQELIAIIEPEKRLACFLVDGEPRAQISGLVGDFDGTHVCSRKFADYLTIPIKLVLH